MGALRAGFHGTVGQPSAQVIDGSLKFHGDRQYYLKKTPYVGNRKTWTISFWVKRSEGSASDPGIFSTYAGVSGPAFTCYFNSSDKLRIYNDESGYNLNLVTAQVFRDYNSWYHIVISIDTTQTTASDKAKLYVNGVRVTEFSTELYPGDIDLDWNTATEHNIGNHVNEYDGNISNFYHIDGHSFGPEYFGFTDPLTNTWRPKKLEQFPKRSFTNPRWYSSATVYTSVADVVANATDRGNGGVTVTNEYCYLVFNDGGYGTSGGEVQSPDYPVWSDVPSFSGLTRVFYYDSGEADNWANAASYSSAASEWNQWRYSNSATKPSSLAYRISPYAGIENGNMLVFCANAFTDNPTNAGTLASITLPTFDTNSFHFQNSVIDTWYTGGNSFYLPMDGNSPIGEDKFGNGNNWTPWYFGGSNSIEKATGALPILNTTNGGNTATVGVRTDATVAAGVGTCALALPLVGNKDDISNQIDSKSSQKNIILNGDPTEITTVSNFYGGSYYFDGTGDYLNTTSVYSDLNFKTGDFTIEAWCYVSAGANNVGLWQLSYTSGGLRPDDLQLSCHYQNTKFNFGSAGGSRINGKDYSTNRWHHVAEVRKDGVISTYINGVLDQSWDDTSNYWEGDTYVCVGGYWNTSYLWNGYIQDFRIYNGVAKYTSDFIPASTNPDILPNTPSGVSGSSKLTKITDGAVYFNGTDDYLEIADNTDFELGTGDFTIEAFIYNPVDAVQSIIAKYDNGNSVRSFWLGTISLNNPSFYWYSGNNAYNINGGAGTLPTNKWSHIVAQRTSGNMYLFIDGKVVNSDTTANAALSLNNITHPLRIGSDTHQQGLEFEGYISNVRIVKGTGVYNTSGFTPPTEPLTNVTNTTLLCCQSNKLAGTAAVSPNISGGLNDGTVWSEEGQSVNVGASTPISYAFDGDTASYVLPVNNTTMRYDFPFLITGTKFEILNSVSLATNGFSVNGQSSANVSGPQSVVWSDVTDAVTASGLGGLSYITMGYLSANWSQVVYAFRVDDVILVDPVSAVNAKISTLNPFNTDINTVRGQETNHCTWNPLHTLGTFTSTYQYSNDNLDFTTIDSPNLGGAATIGVKSGRWYWEIIHTQLANNTYDTATYVAYDTFNLTARDRGIAYLANGQKKMNDVNTDYGATYTTNDVIGVALDADNDKVTYFKNGASQGELSITHLTPNTGYYPAIHQVNGSNNLTGSANFGQKPFKFPPPDGYQPLNNANVRPETVIARPDQYVGVTTYPGTALTQSIDHFNFKPDLAWIKVTDNQRSNFLFDSVRGAENYLISDTNGLQVNDSTTLTSFDLNGFTVGTSPDVNRDTSEIVAWAWKAGGNKNTFNVDDVGYANASDINMNAGALNSTIYDQSQTWSSNSTLGSGNIISDGGGVDHVVSRIFDGNSSTSCIPEKGTASSEVSLDLTSTIIGVTKIRVQTSSVDNFSINGGSNIASTGNGYQTIYDGSAITLTSLKFIRTSGVSGGGSNTGFSVTSVEINGKQLIDSGVTPSINLPSISATGCSIGTKQGFSIVTYDSTGSSLTLGHGLSQKPDFFIFKCTSHDQHWAVGHSYDYTAELYLGVDGGLAAGSSTTSWGSGPDNNVFTLGTSDYVNTADREYVCYSWHDVPGLQKFGTYQNNTGTNGRYIDLGFKPALFVIKRTDTTGEWWVYDGERNPINLTTANVIRWNSSGVETEAQTTYAIDFLSNGFKIRNNSNDINANANTATYIYAAWAESPAINLYGGTSNAR